MIAECVFAKELGFPNMKVSSECGAREQGHSGRGMLQDSRCCPGVVFALIRAFYVALCGSGWHSLPPRPEAQLCSEMRKVLFHPVDVGSAAGPRGCLVCVSAGWWHTQSDSMPRARLGETPSGSVPRVLCSFLDSTV